MLPRLRRFRFLLLCCASALGWVTAGTLDMLGAVDIDDDLVVIAGAGLITVVLLGHVGVQISSHQVRHRRLDRQVGAATLILRRGFHEDGNGDRIPAALLDDRTQLAGAEVVEIRPRASAAPRHRRSQRRRP